MICLGQSRLTKILEPLDIKNQSCDEQSLDTTASAIAALISGQCRNLQREPPSELVQSNVSIKKCTTIVVEITIARSLSIRLVLH